MATMHIIVKQKRLITSALPYVNNIPHLGNLVQLISADVYARYCRLAGFETLYVCGTDEYGTATETRARGKGITPQELCDTFYTEHKNIYKWFNISFDNFGRTSRAQHRSITQSIFLQLYKSGFVTEHTTKQLFSESMNMFLADRYIVGTCPHCSFKEARGDQCEKCGTLLDPMDLVNPRCVFDNSPPVLKETSHLYVNLPELTERLESFLEGKFSTGYWAKNAVQMTRAWIRDGLKERTITRDLSWGIPVPLENYSHKVFYVWFDAPIGYISITAEHTEDWTNWWKAPEEVELVQFVGKDNIPFHTVIFPACLLGTGEEWTLVNQMSSSEYLTYKGGAFSKSRNVGVFGSDVLETGIPADVWRFYIIYNRPESSDYAFTWKDFQETVNSELIGNFSNFVNRILKFITRSLKIDVLTALPSPDYNNAFWDSVKEAKSAFVKHMERTELRKAIRTMLSLSDMGNKLFQAAEPWKQKEALDTQLQVLLGNLLRLVLDLSTMASVFLPDTAERIRSLLEYEEDKPLSLDAIATPDVRINKIRAVEVLFSFLDKNIIKKFDDRYSGDSSTEETSSIEEQFDNSVDLVVAVIQKAESHPDAEKLYVINLDDGSEAGRVIVSGLRGYYEIDELEGKHIVLVKNLKPSKLRGIQSNGMLLAASQGDDLELLEVPWAVAGTSVRTEGGASKEIVKRIDIKKFLSMKITVKNHTVGVGKKHLECDGKPVRTNALSAGDVS